MPQPAPLSFDGYEVIDQEGRTCLKHPDQPGALFALPEEGLEDLSDAEIELVFKCMLDALNTGVQVGYQNGLNDGHEYLARHFGLATKQEVSAISSKLDILIGAQATPEPEIEDAQVINLPATRASKRGTRGRRSK